MILTKYKWKTVWSIWTMSSSFPRPWRTISNTWTKYFRASPRRVTLKIAKCKFFTTTVEYLGHIIRPGKLEVDQTNTKSLREAKPPTTRTQIRSFLDLVNVYRRFIDRFSKKAGPLSELLKKDSLEKFTLNVVQRLFVVHTCARPT